MAFAMAQVRFTSAVVPISRKAIAIVKARKPLRDTIVQVIAWQMPMAMACAIRSK